MHGTTEPEHYAVSKNISDGQAEKNVWKYYCINMINQCQIIMKRAI